MSSVSQASASQGLRAAQELVALVRVLETVLDTRSCLRPPAAALADLAALALARVLVLARIRYVYATVDRRA